MTPGRKLTTRMSAVLTRRWMISTAFACFRSSTRLFLPAFNWPNEVLAPFRSGSRARIISPPSGVSILITSAPISAINRVQCGPAIVVVKSRTRTPSRAFGIGVSRCLRAERSGSGYHGSARLLRRSAPRNDKLRKRMEIRHNTHGRHIAVVTIDNQKRRNAMTRAMMAELANLWERLDADPACRAVVLTGAGDKAFCAGADISGDLSASAETARAVNRALLKDIVFTKPIVAAVNGDCAGG